MSNIDPRAIVSPKAELAADAMGITSPRLHELGLVDEIIAEPRGGAHRDFDTAAAAARTALVRHPDELDAMPAGGLLQRRLERLRGYGGYKEG